MRRRSLLAGAALVGGCIAIPGRSEQTRGDSRPRIVTTTGILADLARHVAGPDVRVVSLIPEGGDPHSYEPLPRDIREIAYADLALSNYMMLEEQSLIRTVTANLPQSAAYLALAEQAVGRGATIIPLVENRSLDTIWLGLRVQGGDQNTARSSQVTLTLAGCAGPGSLTGYVTGTFGQPDVIFHSTDEARTHGNSIELPTDAHTHMSWAMTEPGHYRTRFRATWRDKGSKEERSVVGDLHFAIGSLPPPSARQGREVIDSGHADLTVDIKSGKLVLRVDDPVQSPSIGAGEKAPPAAHSASRCRRLTDVLVHVPPKALLPVPSDPAFRFIASPGTDVYQLPQAVLGKHVHGDIDPHLWHDVTNAQAYVEVIRDEMQRLDPARAGRYGERAARYLSELDTVDDYVRGSIDTIPPDNRNLVTTHDAYGYLAHRYGLAIAGVVSPAPGHEPSIADRRRLSTTLRDLKVPAVFLEATAPGTSRSLLDAARTARVTVRPIWGDSFTPEVSTYASMMRANADSLARGLGGRPRGTTDLLYSPKGR